MAFVVPVMRKNYILYSNQHQPSLNKKSQSRTDRQFQISTSLPVLLSTLQNNSPTIKSTQNKSKKIDNGITPIKSVKCSVQNSPPIAKNIKPVNNISHAAFSTNNVSPTLKSHRTTTTSPQLTLVMPKKEDLMQRILPKSTPEQNILKENKIVNDRASIGQPLPSVSNILPSEIITRLPTRESIDEANQQDSGYTSSTALSPTSPKTMNLSSQSAPPSPTFAGAYSARQIRPRLRSERISIRRLNDEDDDELFDKVETPLVRHVHFGFCEQIEYEDSDENSVTQKDEKLSKLKKLEQKLAAQLKFSRCATIFKPRANTITSCSLENNKTKKTETKSKPIFDELGRALSAENFL